MNAEKQLQNYEVEFNPTKVLEMESGISTKLGKKAKSIAKILILFTAINLGCSREKSEDNILEKPKYTIEDIENIKNAQREFLKY